MQKTKGGWNNPVPDNQARQRSIFLRSAFGRFKPLAKCSKIPKTDIQFNRCPQSHPLRPATTERYRLADEEIAFLGGEEEGEQGVFVPGGEPSERDIGGEHLILHVVTGNQGIGNHC